jgi:glutathione S-transferase
MASPSFAGSDFASNYRMEVGAPMAQIADREADANQIGPTVIAFYDYLPSQNGWKVRQILRHLEIAHETRYVSIFEGEGQQPEYLAINPTGAVPAIVLEDGRPIAESNAILTYLSQGTRYYPKDRFESAKVQQWMSFEADYVQTSIGSLRYWTLTGKLPNRPAALVEGKRAAGAKALEIMNRELSRRPFIAGPEYTIADISLFAYSHLAEDAGIEISACAHVRSWIERLKAEPKFDATHYPYSIDPHSRNELP